MNGWLLAFYIIGAWALLIIIFLVVWAHLFDRGRDKSVIVMYAENDEYGDN